MVKIVVLLENTTESSKLKCKHGFSLYNESPLGRSPDIPGTILYSFPRKTTAPSSLPSVRMMPTIRCWEKAHSFTM